MAMGVKGQGQMTDSFVHRFVSDDLKVRVTAVDATQVVEYMRHTQDTMPLSTVAGGRAMIGALLMASHLKGDQEVSLDFQSNGELQRVYAQANAEGGVRGFVLNPQVNVNPENPSLSLREAMGIGLLTVTTYLPNQTVPHRGVVHIASGEIGEDIAHYYDQSFQIPTLVTLGVHLDIYGRVNAAGGVLVELMPGATSQIIEEFEKNLNQAKGISQQILEGRSVLDIVYALAGNISLKEIDETTRVHYACSCSRERVLRSLSLLGESELEDVLSKGEPLETQCQMCGKHYKIQMDEVSELLQKVKKAALH